jgi:hypothetical protein
MVFGVRCETQRVIELKEKKLLSPQPDRPETVLRSVALKDTRDAPVLLRPVSRGDSPTNLPSLECLSVGVH